MRSCIHVSRSRLLVCLLALTALTLIPACGFQLIPPDLDSGIEGTMLAGPQCPVENPDNPDCADKPYQGTVIVKTPNGLLQVTRFTADADGRFRVPLYPGTYLLDPLPGTNGLPRVNEQTVEVNPGTFTDVAISYDTGIR
jgi:hypothetical protein